MIRTVCALALGIGILLGVANTAFAAAETVSTDNMRSPTRLTRPTMFLQTPANVSLPIESKIVDLPSKQIFMMGEAAIPKEILESIVVKGDQLSALDFGQAVSDLRKKKLLVPIDGSDPELMKGSFYAARVGHVHHAVDIITPRNTPIRATDDGIIARLFTSAAGGITIYQTDKNGKYVYYYAHLEKYADGLKEGDLIKKGQIIGYVGTSGNAPENLPHLHFSISVIGESGNVFRGGSVDPYEVFKSSTPKIAPTGTKRGS